MLKSNILFSARQKGLRSNVVSSVRKICLQFDGAQRKSDPYHLAYFLLTSIEKNYRKRNEIPTDGYTFLCRNYSFFSNSVWWVFQPDSRQISVNYRRQNTTWESWLLKRFQAKRKYFFFVKLNDHHCISNTQDFLIIKVSFILNICTNFDTWYYWGRISEIDAHLLMNWMADDFFLTSNDF